LASQKGRRFTGSFAFLSALFLSLESTFRLSCISQTLFAAIHKSLLYVSQSAIPRNNCLLPRSQVSTTSFKPNLKGVGGVSCTNHCCVSPRSCSPSVKILCLAARVFLAGRSPITGVSNATSMHSTLWRTMIQWHWQSMKRMLHNVVVGLSSTHAVSRLIHRSMFRSNIDGD